MHHSPDAVRAALLLTNRLVPLDAKPMTAREFWQLAERCDLGDLLHADVRTIAEHVGVDADEAGRLRTLLDAATALAFEQTRLQDSGIELLSALDDRFPARVRARLRHACPPFLLVAGPEAWLDRPGLGIVGSRDADEGELDVARRAAVLAVEHGWPVMSGLARGVDQAAMAAAIDAGGEVVGVPAEGITRVARSADLRRRVHAGELCIASPYAPDAPFRAGNAMGRNKIVYALSRVTFVVASEQGSGGTWSGATEALERGYAPVAVWTGAGANDANRVLVERGAHPVSEPSQLLEIAMPEVPPMQSSLF